MSDRFAKTKAVIKGQLSEKGDDAEVEGMMEIFTEVFAALDELIDAVTKIASNG